MGPLNGLKVVEMAGIGPVPFCSMQLADMGADVLRVDRTAASGFGIETKFNILNRSRRSVAVDLKSPGGAEVVLKLIENADCLLEGYRPGVMERLGLGPEVCMTRNARLVYGRMTGWGQQGPMAQAAGHDINFISLSGVLHTIGTKDSGPVPPLNLTGDFGGGSMFLAFGVMAALWEAQRSGKGQVVDVSMVEGSACLMSAIYGLKASGYWQEVRGTNILDTGAPFYNAYETKDGKHVSIGSIEPKFYEELMEKSGLGKMRLPAQQSRDKWDEMTEVFREVFKQKTRDEWCGIMEGSDICFAPILSMEEAPRHPQNVARGSFVEVDGVVQPAPAPRFSRTKAEVQRPPAKLGQHTVEGLKDWGIPEAEINRLREAGVVVQS